MKRVIKCITSIILCFVIILSTSIALAEGVIKIIDPDGTISTFVLGESLYSKKTKDKKIDENLQPRLQRMAYEYDWVMAQVDELENKEEYLKALFTVMYLANTLQSDYFNLDIIGTGRITLNDIAECLDSAGVPYEIYEMYEYEIPETFEMYEYEMPETYEIYEYIEIMGLIHISVYEYDETMSVLIIRFLNVLTSSFEMGEIKIFF